MMEYIPEVVLWCLATCLIIAVVLIVRQRHIDTLLRGRVAALENELVAVIPHPASSA